MNYNGSADTMLLYQIKMFGRTEFLVKKLFQRAKPKFSGEDQYFHDFRGPKLSLKKLIHEPKFLGPNSSDRSSRIWQTKHCLETSAQKNITNYYMHAFNVMYNA